MHILRMLLGSIDGEGVFEPSLIKLNLAKLKLTYLTL